jgi:hypothetical protein
LIENVKNNSKLKKSYNYVKVFSIDDNKNILTTKKNNKIGLLMFLTVIIKTQ